MEDITMIRKDSNQDGQIFVLGAMLIAIILVSLAFSLNMVIYSENTAARGSAVAEENALDHYNTLENMFSGDIQSQNNEQYMSRSNIATSTESSLDLLIKAERERQARKTTVVETTYTPTYGILLAQDDENRSFTSQGGSDDWSLTTNSINIREFQQNIDASSVSSVSNTTINNGNYVASGVLTIDFSGRDVYVYEHDGNTIVRVQGATPCTLTGSPSNIQIDYIEATVNGNSCSGLSFVAGNNWDISIQNGSAGDGTYGLMAGAGTPESDISTGNFVNPNTSSNNPYYHHIVTEVTYTSYYDGPKQTSNLTATESASLPSDTQ